MRHTRGKRKSANSLEMRAKKMEATPGIEPGYTDLQSDLLGR